VKLGPRAETFRISVGHRKSTSCFVGLSLQENENINARMQMNCRARMSTESVKCKPLNNVCVNEAGPDTVWKTSSEIQRRTKTDREAQSKLVFTHHRGKICRYVEPVSDAIVKWETRNNGCVSERHEASRDTFLKASPEMEKITPSKPIFTHHRKENLCRCVEYVSGAIVKWEPPNNICVGGSREASPNLFLRALSEK
jgi:hypothetical protein